MNSNFDKQPANALGASVQAMRFPRKLPAGSPGSEGLDWRYSWLDSLGPKVVSVFVVAYLLANPSPAISQDKPAAGGSSKVQKSESDEYLAAIRERMLEIAKQIEIKVMEPEGELKSAKLVPKPVFRYTDQPTRIRDASLWVWTHEGRPVAIQKLEAYRPKVETLWTSCFASLSTERITAKWPDLSGAGPRSFEAKTPGLKFETLRGIKPPPEKKTARKLMLRRISRRFSSFIVFHSRKEAKMRLLPRPLFEYIGEGDKPCGAVFGFGANGTNPDYLVAVEIGKNKAGKREWQYSLCRLSARGARVLMDDKPLQTLPAVDAMASRVFDSWTFFFDRREVLTQDEARENEAP